MERTEKAYAKLNLYLDVTGKRPDGFHNLKSVMHTVTLADTVTVNAKLADYSCVTVEMVNSDIPADERNLAYLAAVAFMAATAIGAFFGRFTLGAGLFAAGGLLFTASDNILFAYKYGENPRFIQNILLHVFYYAAQILIAWSIAFI